MHLKKPPLFNFWYRRYMKWPDSLLVIRHDVSIYNSMKEERAKNPLYRQFSTEFEKDPASAATRQLALAVNERFALQVSDPDTPLLEVNSPRIVGTGQRLRLTEELPDVIFVSPYRRNLQTLEGLTTGWPELRQVCRIYEEERIREQSHGLAGLYNDWRVFFALYPEQKKLYDSEGSYWYQWPQGERVPDVRLRIRSWMNTLTRDFANKRVMAISHHLTKLALRANLERWSAEEFQRVDRDEKPINCGVTKYRGLPNLGHNGHFALEYYNRDFSIYL